MTAHYVWTSPKEDWLKRVDEANGMVTCFPADLSNSDYVAFLESGEVAEEYVEPDPIIPTPEEKLAASGLTVDELKSLLGIQ